VKAPEGVLVSTEWLASQLGAPDLCVVDIRGKVLPPGAHPRYVPKREDYDAGHVPGAAFVDWTRDIVDLDDPVPAQVARPDAFAAKMSELGIGDDTLVVAYDDYKHIFAGRLAWALRYYGHDAVRVLDGGWTRWIAEGRPTTRDVPMRAPAHFTATPRAELRRTADDVAAALGRSDVLLIDARPPEQYAGAASARCAGRTHPGRAQRALREAGRPCHREVPPQGAARRGLRRGGHRRRPFAARGRPLLQRRGLLHRAPPGA
jgi:thiosulfate/3-mercaptopyruvate sulfurtransferase